jgi:hypothetical protein
LLPQTAFCQNWLLSSAVMLPLGLVVGTTRADTEVGQQVEDQAAARALGFGLANFRLDVEAAAVPDEVGRVVEIDVGGEGREGAAAVVVEPSVSRCSRG